VTSFFDKVYRLLALVPSGKVVSYGQVAAWLGDPRAARTVGWALHGLPEGSGLPWHRVINGQGRITTPHLGHTAIRQRELLELEGIAFGPDERVDMDRYRWAGPTFEQFDAIHRQQSAVAPSAETADETEAWFS
jgi:O-6-methylguanine DNA methyltransferase